MGSTSGSSAQLALRFGVDIGLVWDVVERELSPLRSAMERLIQRFADDATDR
jgi:uncharacterized protein with HEPN domain